MCRPILLSGLLLLVFSGAAQAEDPYSEFDKVPSGPGFAFRTTEIVEQGRAFDVSRRAGLIPGATTLDQTLEFLGAPRIKVYRDGVPLLIWEHTVREYRWFPLGGVDAFTTTRDASGAETFLRSLAEDFGDPIAGRIAEEMRTSREGAWRELDPEAMQERILIEQTVLLNRLEVRFADGADGGLVVAEWEFVGQVDGDRFEESGSWYVEHGEAWHAARAAAESEPDREALEARRRLEEQLDAAGITDPAVRERMIREATE
jgi:hypothetical protein